MSQQRTPRELGGSDYLDKHTPILPARGANRAGLPCTAFLLFLIGDPADSRRLYAAKFRAPDGVLLLDAL